MNSMINEKIREVLAEVCQTFGVSLYDVEWDTKTLRVYIDALDKRDAITIDTCARISEAISLRLDFLDLINHHYILEVSSPGIERKLKVPEHFQGVCGKNVQVVFSREGKSVLVIGKLLLADEEKIVIEDEKGERLELSYPAIKSAQLKVSQRELFQEKR